MMLQNYVTPSSKYFDLCETSAAQKCNYSKFIETRRFGMCFLPSTKATIFMPVSKKGTNKSSTHNIQLVIFPNWITLNRQDLISDSLNNN